MNWTDPNLPDAPSYEKLLLWYPATSSSLEYWSGTNGNDLLINGYNVTTSPGVDNSQRRLSSYPECSLIGYRPAGFAYVGQTMMCWLRIYSFDTINIGGGGYAFYGAVNVLNFTTYNTYHGMFGYTVDALSPYGTQRRLTFTDFVGGYSIQGGFGNTYLPTDEWLHVTWILDAPTGAGTHFYINGRYDGLGAAPILGGGAAMDSPIWIHGPSHGIWSWGDYALKDVRCYQGVLTATEVQYVYEHSLEFHRDSTPLVPQLIFQGAEGEPIPPEFTGQASAHHHILGAM